MTNFLLSLLKLILPSWSLFDRPADHCRLYYRRVGKDISSPWMEITRAAENRNLRQLFINPEDSSWLFFLSLIDECCYKISKNPEYDILSSDSFSFIKCFLNKHYVQSETVTTPIQLKLETFSQKGERTAEYTSKVFICS